jgi:hypothetical protein
MWQRDGRDNIIERQNMKKTGGVVKNIATWVV